MSRSRWSFIGGIAISVMLAAASCSRPTESTQNTQTSPAATPADTSSKESAATPNGRDERPAEEAKKDTAEPAKPAPARHSTPAATPQAPIAVPAQTAASAPLPQAPPPDSAPIPAPVPFPQASAPIFVPDAPAPEPTTKQVTIPAGTQVYVRLIDSVASDKNHTGDTVRASLDNPITIDNQTIIPKRADVFLKLIDVESAGKLKGTSQLKIQLDRIVIARKSYDVSSNTYEQTGESEGKKAVRNVGIGAAVGGVLGGILGGTKGAVIGAGAGGGGGAVVSKGEQMRLDSETQLVFRLENPLDVTITTAPASTRFSTGGGPANLTPPPELQPSSRSASSSSSSNVSDVSGTWTVTTDGPQGSNLQLVIRQNGSNLQGSISNPNGSGTLPIRGSVNGNYVTFSAQTQSQYGSNGAQMQFSGAVQSDSMQGNVTMPAANNGYGGGGGFPGGGGRNGRNRTGTSGTTQAHWSAQRSN